MKVSDLLPKLGQGLCESSSLGPNYFMIQMALLMTLFRKQNILYIMYESGITKSRLTLIFIIFHDSHKPNWLPFILSKFIPIDTTFTFGFSRSTDSIRPITFRVLLNRSRQTDLCQWINSLVLFKVFKWTSIISVNPASWIMWVRSNSPSRMFAFVNEHGWFS